MLKNDELITRFVELGYNDSQIWIQGIATNSINFTIELIRGYTVHNNDKLKKIKSKISTDEKLKEPSNL